VSADAEARLRAQLAGGEPDHQHDDEYPPSWRPEPGDVLIGTVVRVTEGETRYGTCSIAWIERADGSRASAWLTTKVLRDEWSDADPKPGEHVAIRYEGTRTTADGGTTYKVHRVAVDRPGDLPAAPTPAPAPDDDVPF
jgi:hypothetical protein